MRNQILLFLATALLVTLAAHAAHAQMLKAFQADFSAWYPTAPQKGSISGRISYLNHDVKKVKVMEYTNMGGITEFYDYSKKALYRYDPISCSAYNLKTEIEAFDAPLVEENPNDNCTIITVTNAQVDRICVKGGVIVKAMYKSGLAVTFSGVKEMTGTEAVFDLSSNRCPELTCEAEMDLVIVLDSSGSLTPAGWQTVKTFSMNITSKFTIKSSKTMVGIAIFGNDGYKIADLQNDKDNVMNYLLSMEFKNEWTCIGCGLNVAGQIFAASPRAGQVKRVVILMTDGENNKPDGNFKQYLIDAADNIKTKFEAQVFAIGVGNQVKITEMDLVRSPGDTYFPVTGVDKLYTVVNEIVKATCTSFPDIPTCECDGFCGVRQGECLCPTCLQYDNNLCNQYVNCSINTNYGCIYLKKVCPPLDGCRIPLCNVKGECEYLDVDCDDKDPTTDDKCVSLSLTTYSCSHVKNDGSCNFDSDCKASTDRCLVPTCKLDHKCGYVKKDCDDKKSCTEDVCDNGVCYHNFVTCDDNNKCTKDICSEDPSNKVTGYKCSYTSSCPTPSGCEISICNAATGCSVKSVKCGRPTGETATCYAVRCDKASGQCISDKIPNGLKTNGESCWVSAAAVAGLSILGASLIVIGLVLLALLVLGLLAKRRMGRLATRAKDSQVTDIKENELYEAAYGGGNNPLFSEKQA